MQGHWLHEDRARSGPHRRARRRRHHRAARRPRGGAQAGQPTVDTKALHDQIDTQRKLITTTREEYDEGLINARDRNARIERILEKLGPLEDKLLGSRCLAT